MIVEIRPNLNATEFKTVAPLHCATIFTHTNPRVPVFHKDKMWEAIKDKFTYEDLVETVVNLNRSVRFFDLTKEGNEYLYPKAVLEFLICKYNPKIAQSKKSSTPRHMYYINDNELDSIETIKKNQYLSKAISIIETEKNKKDNLRSFLRLFGIKTLHLSDNELLASAYEIATSESKKFVDLFESKDKQYREFIAEGKEKGVIRYEKGSYYYNNVLLGTSEAKAIDFLKSKENADVYNEMKRTIAAAAV